MSNCCCPAWRRPDRVRHRQRSTCLRPAAAVLPSKLKTAIHSSWDCFFRHLQRLTSLSTLSLQRCGLEDRDVRSLSIALQILPAGRLRCLRLNDNSIGLSGLRMLLTALTSRRMRLPALWLRKQRPALVESESKGVIESAFQDGLFAEVKMVGRVGPARNMGDGNAECGRVLTSVNIYSNRRFRRFLPDAILSTRTEVWHRHFCGEKHLQTSA